jgi:excisionase family DNA binding protein
MNEGRMEIFGFSGKPSNHDFLYILFPVRTGDSGFIITGRMQAGEGTMEHLIDITELERRTAIKQATLRKYVVQRKIPFVKIGRLVRFDLPEIEAWIAERKVPVLKRGEIQQGKQESGRLDFQETPEIVHFGRCLPAN